MSSLADTGLLIAALNRGDRHHRWATRILMDARRAATEILVPEVVAGEAFTKLRYDRRVSGRRDASAALALYGLLDDSPGLFRLVGLPTHAHARSRDLLSKYRDQAFSYVDAIVLLTADDEKQIQQLWTVDSSLSAYAFSHPVRVQLPG